MHRATCSFSGSSCLQRREGCSVGCDHLGGWIQFGACSWLWFEALALVLFEGKLILGQETGAMFVGIFNLHYVC